MEDRDKEDFLKIKKVLEFVWENPYSSFYRNKYKKAGINSIKSIKTIKDFKNLPYLTKRELINSDPYDRFFFLKSEIRGISTTSGTTGGDRPLVMLVGKRFDQGQEKFLLQNAKELKIKSCMFLLSPLRAQTRFLKDQYVSDGKILRFIGDISNLPLSAKIASTLKVDGLIVSPTILYFFTPYLRKEYDLSKIKYIVFSGEFCSTQKLNFFKQSYKNAYFEFAYGSAEAINVAFRCKYLSKKAPKLYHPWSLYYFEIDKGGQEGELILSHKHTNSDLPLIRYQTGDLVRLVSEKCECGEDRQIEVFGKLSYDAVRIFGTTIYAEEIYKALFPYKYLLDAMNFQLHVFEEADGKKIKIKLKLELVLNRNNKEDKEKLKKQLEKNISNNLYISSKLTLAALAEKGVFAPLEIEFVKELGYSKSGKKRHIVNHLN